MGLSVNEFEQSVNYKVNYKVTRLPKLAMELNMSEFELIIELSILKVNSNILERRLSKLAMKLNMSKFEQSTVMGLMYVESEFKYRWN